MDYQRSVSRSAERTRLAKLRFLNAPSPQQTGPLARGSAARRSLPLMSRTDRLLPEIDLTIPGTPVSSKYVLALREQRNKNNAAAASAAADENDQVDAACCGVNPFTVFLNSMNTLNGGGGGGDGDQAMADHKRKDKSKDILGLLIERVTAAAAAAAAAKDENKLPLSGEAAATTKPTYGYSNVGTYNGSSNLRIYPSVQRSYVRRLSLQTNFERNGPPPEGQQQRQQQQNEQPTQQQQHDDYYNNGYQQHNDDYGNFVNQKKCHELNGNMHFASTTKTRRSFSRDHESGNDTTATATDTTTTTAAMNKPTAGGNNNDAFRRCEKESRFKSIRDKFESGPAAARVPTRIE